MLKLTVKINNDAAWNSLIEGKNEFRPGTCLFNGCTVTVTNIQEKYNYRDKNGKPRTKCARYWGNIVFPDGTEKSFTKQRSGFVARLTGFYVEKGKELYESQGESYVLPYLR